MPKTRPPYAPEFRRQIVELARAGRDPTDLAREFEPSAQAIRNWIAQADREEGRPTAMPAAAIAADAALSAAEREPSRAPPRLPWSRMASASEAARFESTPSARSRARSSSGGATFGFTRPARACLQRADVSGT